MWGIVRRNIIGLCKPWKFRENVWKWAEDLFFFLSFFSFVLFFAWKKTEITFGSTILEIFFKKLQKEALISLFVLGARNPHHATVMNMLTSQCQMKLLYIIHIYKLNISCLINEVFFLQDSEGVKLGQWSYDWVWVSTLFSRTIMCMFFPYNYVYVLPLCLCMLFWDQIYEFYCSIM